MRIAYIVPSLGPLGPVIVVRNLVERMVAHGHECVVFYFDEREDAMAFACETKRISFWRREDMSGFDWVHAHSFRPMVYAARFCPQRKLVTMHSYIFAEYDYSLGRILGPMLGRFTMFVANRFEHVAVLSQDAKAYYSQWIPAEKMHVCYNGVSIDRIMEDGAQYVEDTELISRFKEGCMLLGCICELVPIKGIDTLIDAMAYLPANYMLLLIGNGTSMQVFQKRAEALHVANRILFLGERVEAHRYLPFVDVYVMASHSEGFGMAMVEAAMAGRMIACADIPGMREKFTDSEVAYFRAGDVQGLADAVTNAGQHPEKADRARAVAETRFSTERMYESYMAIYDSQS